MSAKTQRELRRETKRTLGAKLEEFRNHERARLVGLEDIVNALATDLGSESAQRVRVTEPLRRGFFGRLKWLLVGA